MKASFTSLALGQDHITGSRSLSSPYGSDLSTSQTLPSMTGNYFSLLQMLKYSLCQSMCNVLISLSQDAGQYQSGNYGC